MSTADLDGDGGLDLAVASAVSYLVGGYLVGGMTHQRLQAEAAADVSAAIAALVALGAVVALLVVGGVGIYAGW